MPLRTPLFAALCFCLLALPARAVEFVWSERGTLRVDAAEGWKLKGEPAEEIGFAITGEPASGIPLVFQITIIDLPANRPVREADLVGHLEASLEPYLGQSVEQAVHPIALKMKQGQGWFAELTDARLVGKAPVPDDYKILRHAIAMLDSHTLVIATMQCDDPTSEESGAMLRMVSSLRLERIGAQRSQSSPL